MKPRPWYETYPRKYWTAAERAAAIKAGWKPSAAETRKDVLEQQKIRLTKHLPHQPMTFGGPGPETPERYEERQRRQRVDAILKKHNIGQRPGPWWRV